MKYIITEVVEVSAIETHTYEVEAETLKDALEEVRENYDGMFIETTSRGDDHYLDWQGFGESRQDAIEDANETY